MPSPQYVSIALGQSVSSAFALDRADRLLAVQVASHAALSWHVAFSATSGTAPFARLVNPETGLHWASSFASGGWFIVAPAAPYGRIETGGAVSAVMTCTLHTVMR